MAKTRPRSGTAFPYNDLDSSIAVADAIHNRGGGVCSTDQVAAWLGYKSANSGTYLVRMAAAKQFGLIESQSKLTVAVTDRARTILAPVLPDEDLKARVEAFLDVELFRKVFEQFQGAQLPAEAGLKNLFANTYKIVPDRVAPAIRVFINSAEQAGFFSTAGDQSRLIQPTLPGQFRNTQVDAVEEKKTDSGIRAPQRLHETVAAGENPAGVHSAIIGLLRELPAAGSPWPSRKKKRFLSAFEATIDFIYPDDESDDDRGAYP